MKEEVTAALALPRMLLFLQVDRDGNLTLDGERIGSGIAEHLADTFEQVGERCLSDIEAIEDSFAEALERAARNGDVSGADREAILRKLREFRGGARGNLTRTAQGALRAAGGSGAAARALRRAGHIGAVATSLQLAWNMIHELMDECAPQCNKFKPRGCSD